MRAARFAQRPKLTHSRWRRGWSAERTNKMSETLNVESAPAVAVQRVVRARSNFNQWFTARDRIKAAKAEAKKRAKKKYDQEHYDEYKKLQGRTAARVKAGIPLEAPVMKP